MTKHQHWLQTGMDGRERSVNPPFAPADHPGPMSKGELFMYHLENGSMARFYELYPENRPKQRDSGRER